jgi:transcriptional regulator with XRE-family HTH domain
MASAGLRKRLAQEMQNVGYTQAELARLCKVSKGHMSGILTGKNKPSERLVNSFALALGVTVDYLLKGGKRQELPIAIGQDREFVALWRGLSPEGKKLLEYLARVIARAENSSGGLPPMM